MRYNNNNNYKKRSRPLLLRSMCSDNKQPTPGMLTGADRHNNSREDTAKVYTSIKAVPVMRAAVTTAGILLSLARPTDAFAPFSVVGRSTGLRRTANAGCVARTGAAEVGARKRKASNMMAGDAVTLEKAIDGDPVDVTKSSQAILNNDMNPFVTIPRRDAREWFDGLREQARPRPAGIAELSRWASILSTACSRLLLCVWLGEQEKLCFECASCMASSVGEGCHRCCRQIEERTWTYPI